MTLDQIAAKIRSLPKEAGDAGLQAAVAAIFRPGPELLFIEREIRVGDPWSGHMAFPGGRRKEGEPLLDTAIRETREEIGVDLRPHDFLGALPDVPTHRTGLVVRCYVFALRGEVDPRPQEEVADVVWAPILPMMRGEFSSSYEFLPDGFKDPITLPSYRLGERVVWGLTYRMLELLFEAIL